MSISRLSDELKALAAGQDVTLDWSECNRLFPPGLHTPEGRQAMYSRANALGCDVRWSDHTVRFTKR